MDYKEFYEIKVTLFEGSQFDEDCSVEYYESEGTANGAMEEATDRMFQQFECGYDDEDIEIEVVGNINYIKAQNKAGERDLCKVEINKLVMNIG